MNTAIFLLEFALIFVVWLTTMYLVDIKSRINLCGNVTGCFFSKETTHHILYNFVPDMEYLPPNMPTGEYMNECEVYYLNISLGIARIYGEVYRPILYKKNNKG